MSRNAAAWTAKDRNNSATAALSEKLYYKCGCGSVEEEEESASLGVGV